MNKKHLNVVCAVIVKGDYILCVQRASGGEVGSKWEFPGGKIETNESKKEAIVREIKEELNCDIKVVDYLGSIYHEYETFNITLHALKSEMISEKFELREHTDFVWSKVEDIKNIDFADADKKIIDRLIMGVI